MKKNFLAISFIFLSLTETQAALPPQSPAKSREEFCERIKDPDYFRGQMYDPGNLLSFTNDGGFLNKGVCWWHSMFQRNSVSLMVFRPDLPKPTVFEGRALIADIVAIRGVVEVPGYNNLYEFSKDFHRDIQTALELWQIGDGVLLAGWLRGISGETDVPPETLKKMMDELYNEVITQKRITFQMLQIPGIEAHAWLVTDIEKTNDGYILDVVDSNYFGNRQVKYVEGMTHLDDYRSVPYTSRRFGTFSSYKYAHTQYCKYGRNSVDLRPQEAN